MARKKHVGFLLGSISGIIIGLAVGLLVLIFQYPITEYQNSPRILYETQSQQFPEVCPKGINFGNSMNANFNIKYKNIGKAVGDLTVELCADKLTSRLEGTRDDFCNVSSRTWSVVPGAVEEYKFKLKRDLSADMQNLTLTVYESCMYNTMIKSNKSCGSLVKCCNYKRISLTNNYMFVDDKCDNLPIAVAEPKDQMLFGSLFEKLNARLFQNMRSALYQ